MKLTSFTHICREIKDVPIYALYPESFCMKNLATRKIQILPIKSSDCLDKPESIQIIHGLDHFLTGLVFFPDFVHISLKRTKLASFTHICR